MAADTSSAPAAGETPMDTGPAAKKAKPADEQIMVEFKSENGDSPFPPFVVPVDIDPAKLEALLKAMMKHKAEEEDDDDDDAEEQRDRPYLFYLSDLEIVSSLSDVMRKVLVNKERALPVVYKPQAVFRVRPVSRCTSTMPGHSQPVVVALFSPDGRHLASGSGDKTVRFWDITTETPQFVGKAHQRYVTALAWAPDGLKLASGDRDGKLAVWDPETGLQVGRTLTGHTKYITALVWQPLHLTENGTCRKLASSSADGDVRIWDVCASSNNRCLLSLTSHTKSVKCLRWGAGDLIYSCSQDRTIKVWRASDGVLCRTLEQHAHWVNVLALNTDYVMRTAAFEPADARVVNDKDAQAGTMVMKQRAQKRLDQFLKTVPEELMVSGSDDSTLCLWRPATSKSSILRMTGHQQLINDARFSPDGRFVASASFDKSVRLWDGRTGQFVARLLGHVSKVFQLAWSADSRYVVSASEDSTVKIWATTASTSGRKKQHLTEDLPGHGDAVYAVDWSPDGQRVVSAGKDTVLKIWRR